MQKKILLLYIFYNLTKLRLLFKVIIIKKKKTKTIINIKKKKLFDY